MKKKTGSTFAQGANPPGSNVQSAKTVQVSTSVVSLPKLRYAQSGGKKKRG